MILVNILGKKYPLTHTDTTIECYGIVIYRGTEDQVMLTYDSYKLFGLPVKIQMKLAKEIKELEEHLNNAKEEYSDKEDIP